MTPADIYLSINKVQYVKNLRVFSIEIYRRSFFIKNFYEIENYLEDIAKGRIEYNKDNELINDCIFHKITDYVHLIIFFENYIKSELLLKNICIHKIILSKNKKLFNKQKNEPIFIDEILQNEKPKFINNKYYLESISQKTLSISEILNERYLKYLNINPEIISFIKRIVKERNELHLITDLELNISSKDILVYKMIEEFILERYKFSE